ncbi:hypothetical protein ABIC63_000534 [Pseudacidovorax sp. 1753]|uniref:DUF7673 family protein n=1 Tax=Pseudacidovorax sp. 1753 TaxID=3156419 RepID=UPI003392CA4B
MSEPDALPPGLQALRTFYELAANHSHGGARVAAKLLLGLYNGARFPFELTELRCLDDKHLTMALELMRFDATPKMEVHDWLNRLYGRKDFGMRFEHLAHAWRMKGRCKKAYLEPIAPIELRQ